MKWYGKGVVVATIVMMPAAGFCFANYMGKSSKEIKSPEQPAAAPQGMGQAPVKQEKGPTHVGKVLETMNGGGYTYIYLEKKDGEKKWYAVPEAAVKVGEQVELMQGMDMGKFNSRALNRTFDSINFSGGIVLPEDDEAIKKKAHEGIVTAEKEDVAGVPIKVEKAAGENAFTVAELYQKKSALNGKQVVVRGKVVKVSAGIMGKNWIHLRDGSGDAAKGTHNLIVTSQEVPAMGDVVTVAGDFFGDKDFGSGYKYDVIIENASIKK